MATFAALAEALRYGYGLYYALRIQGIPYQFVERLPSGAGAPTGYAFDEALVTDAIGPVGEVVDRKTGIGQAYDLTFQLRRTSVTRALFRRPTAITGLRTALTSVATEVEVGATTDFGSSGNIYIGRETIAYGAKGTGAGGHPAFQTITRGAPNGDWTAYEVPLTSGLATWVTNTPLYWRGRLVQLWVYYLDAWGRNHATRMLPSVGSPDFNEAEHAALLWQGHIDDEPEAEADGWVLSCRSYGRRLANPVGTPLTGDAVWNVDDDPLVRVDTAASFHIAVDYDADTAWDVEAHISPFAGLAATERASTVRDAFKSAWDTEFSSSSNVGDLEWHEFDAQVVPGAGIQRRWRAVVPITTSGTTICEVGITAYATNAAGLLFVDGNGGNHSVQKTTDMVAGSAIFAPTPLYMAASGELFSVTIRLDDGDPTAAPSAGWVKLDAGENSALYRYDDVATQGDLVTLRIVPRSGPPIASFTEDVLTDAYTGEVGASLLYRDSGSYRALMLRMLMSSGRGDNDGTYDTLPLGQGYDLADVDTDAFAEVLDGGWTLFYGDIAVDDEVSFERLFGPLLALSGRAVVPVSDGAAVKLTPVRTSVYDTGAPAVTITDTHLVTDGAGSPPIRKQRALQVPNQIKVKVLSRFGEANAPPVIINDVHARNAQGAIDLEIEALGVSRAAVRDVFRDWAYTRFADRGESQLYEIDVVPWLDVRVGDAIRIESSSFRFVDPATAELGYSGPARVIGSELQRASQVRTLLVVLQGTWRAITLSPSAQVVSFTGSPGVSDIIRVAGKFYPLMAAYLTSSNPFTLLAYQPSYDSTSYSYTIDAVALVGGLTELTVAGVGGSPTLTTDWFLTLPATSAGNDAQAAHLHTDTEGAIWA